MSGLERTERSPVLREKSETNLMLSGFGVLTVRKGNMVISNRDRALASLTSSRIAGTVYSFSQLARRVEIDGLLLRIGLVSNIMEWIDFPARIWDCALLEDVIFI